MTDRRLRLRALVRKHIEAPYLRAAVEADWKTAPRSLSPTGVPLLPTPIESWEIGQAKTELIKELLPVNEALDELQDQVAKARKALSEIRLEFLGEHDKASAERVRQVEKLLKRTGEHRGRPEVKNGNPDSPVRQVSEPAKSTRKSGRRKTGGVGRVRRGKRADKVG